MSAVLLTAATPVSAQVTVDLKALQALPERPASSHPAERRPPVPAPRPATAAVAPLAAPPGVAPPGVAPPSASAGSAPASAATRNPIEATPQAPPPMPENVPQTATLAPVEPPAASSPPPPPVSGTAATAAAATSLGLRLTFAPGASDLSPGSNESIKQLTEGAASGDATTFNVLAYAPGRPDDPSTARRISLSRAMAVRSALVADGVPSSRIFVRALGEQHGDGPPDRVDVNVTGGLGTSDRAPPR